MDGLQLFQKSTPWCKHPKLYPFLSGFLGPNLPYRTTMELRRRSRAAGRAGSLWAPPVQHLWHGEGHLIPLQSGGATSEPSVRGLIPSCLWSAGKLKCSMWSLCVIKEERVEKNPHVFLLRILLEKHVLSAVRPHSMLILKAYMQEFETGGFVDPGRKSRFQTEAQEKNNLLFHLYLLFLYW